MNFSKNPKRQNDKQEKQSFAEREFDAYLLEVDDYLGDAPGLRVPQDFAARVVERARVEMLKSSPSVTEGWSLRQWFFGFSGATRLAIATAVLLAIFCGFRAGQAVTDILARQAKPQPAEMADPLGLAVPEQSIVQLIRNDGLAAHPQLDKATQANKPAGEER